MDTTTTLDRSLLARLDRLHARVRGSALLYRFTLATRILLACGFIPTGMVKVLGRRFTVMDPATEVGAFFETMYQSGPYWRFIGATQVVAGILMLIPRTATLGAVLFTPVITSIFVITVSYGFVGTPIVTGLMLLATVYLMCWDWNRLRGIVFDAPRAAAPLAVQRLGTVEFAIYAVGTAAGLAAFLSMRGLVLRGLGMPLLVLAALAAMAAAGASLAAALGSRRTRVGVAQG